MADPSLHSAVVKLDRAQEHIRSLHEAILKFMDEQGDMVVDEFELATGWYIGRFRQFEPFPLRWGAVLGDAIQNTRSALDHTVYQLIALSRKNPKRFRSSGWPIVSDHDDYWKGKRDQPPLRDSYLGGVAEKYRKLIDKFQPKPGEGHPFAILNRLSNADKHRILPVSSMRPRRADLLVPHPGFRPVWPRDEDVPHPLKDGTELYRWRIDDPAWPKLEVDMQRRITFRIFFGERADPLEAVEISEAVVRAILQKDFDPLFSVSAFEGSEPPPLDSLSHGEAAMRRLYRE